MANDCRGCQMSDAKESNKGERLEPAPDRVSSPDAQAARAAGAGDMASVEKQRTNASDGSLRRYNPANLAAQEHSIELVYEGRTASRTDKKTERELLREMANKPENSTTQDLESIAKDKSLPEDKRTLAEMIQEMRTQSKALGAPTDALDAYAREALQAELLAKSKTQLPQNDEQDSCGSFSYTDAKKGMTIGSHTYAADQLIAQGDVQNQVVSDATNAKATDVMYGRVEESHPISPSPLSNNLDGWITAGQRISALPIDQQAQVIGAALVAGAEQYQHDENERRWGQLIGTVQGIGEVSTNLAKIVDFSGAVLFNDKKVAGTIGEEFGQALGQTVVGGIRLFEAADKYFFNIGYTGDYSKPFRDVVAIGNALNEHWGQLPPREQERLKYKLITELTADTLIGAGGAQAIGKAKKLTEILDIVALESKNFAAQSAKKVGTSAAELTGKLLEESRQKLNNAANSVAQFLEFLVVDTGPRPAFATAHIGPVGLMEQFKGPIDKFKQGFEAWQQKAEDFIHRMSPWHLEGKKKSIGAAKAAEIAGVQPDELSQLSESQLKAKGLEYLPKRYDDLFYEANPHLSHLKGKLEVHHKITQALLDEKWVPKGTFSAKEINGDASMLVGIRKDLIVVSQRTGTRMTAHQAISDEWNNFLKQNKGNITRDKVFAKLAEIDKHYGQYYEK